MRSRRARRRRFTSRFSISSCKQALELLADLFHHSRFDSKEVEKEKQVVLEEIRMVQDDPEDLVQELHTGQVLGRHPLGRSILGREDTIQSLRRPDLLGYIDAHYDPGQIVIAIAGSFEQATVERLVQRYFGKRKPVNGLSRCPAARRTSVGASSSRRNNWNRCICVLGSKASPPAIVTAMPSMP